jgi:NADPH:quinone reductase-like Zn-dependent oxidoreductase
MPKAIWKPHEKHGRLTTQSDQPDSVYAFPKQRKEPLTDAQHVRNAVARFDQVIGVSDGDRALAFVNIEKAARYYDVNFAETSWHDLGIHPQKNKSAAARRTRRCDMKAVVVHQYGGPEVLQFEEYPDPVAGRGEVLVRVAATSVNPIDYKRRAGLMKDFYPIHFPGLVGVDVAGTVVTVGPGVEGFSRGDQVFAMAADTYAELCVVKAAILAKVPKGLDLIQAAALPLVTTTGNQLISATGIKSGQTVLVVGAAGNVGRSAVYTAKQRGAVVIAGVLKSQMDDAKTIGADQLIATDDDNAIANLPMVDVVADTVNGKTAEKLIGKVKSGGVFASVLGAPRNADKYPTVTVVPVYATPDAKTLQFMAEAVRDGKLVIPISRKLPLSRAAEAQAAAEAGGIGKVLLVA